ncbi:MAG: hypothetical protein OXR64_11950 [Chloroflexota bacterium]|nr:hypothetical protein [Chloroflexota bacterium]
MTQHHPTESTHPPAAPRALTRRRALRLAGIAGAGALAAACGEPDIPKIQPPVLPSTQRTQTAATQTTESAATPLPTVIVTAGDRAPSREGALPQAGANRPISIALPTFAGGNWDVEPILLSAELAARQDTDGRYKFTRTPLPSNFGYRWDYASTVDDGSGNTRTDLVMLEQWDLANLVAGNKLLPLDEHLTSDSTFNPGAYWPGILETGKVEGVQYAMPVAAAPWITIVNRDLAAAADYQIPPRSAWDGQAFVEAALAMHGDPEAPGGSDALGLLLNVEPMWGAPDQLWSWTPSFLFLQSALGALPDSQGTFAPLRSDPAKAIAETYYDLATTYGLAESADSNRRPLWFRYTQGELAMLVMSLGGLSFGWMTRSSGPDNVLYPFPRFGSGGAPVSVWMMMGIGNGTQEPKVAYDALRALDRNTQRVANVPAQRLTPEELKRLFVSYSDEAAQMVVDIMQTANYVTVDRPQWGAFVNQLDAGIIRDELSANEALTNLTHRLEELGARV